MSLAAAVTRYADRLHRALGAEHHVASPLGAWIVLALAGPVAADEGSRQRLSEVLGLPIDEAAEAARRLLAVSHPVVALAAAAWSDVDSAAVRTWLDGLGPDVARGPLPTQAKADEWARRHTDGLISKFPIDLGRVVLVLASAVATRISWRIPFGTVAAAQVLLPRAPGFDGVTRLLATQHRKLGPSAADEAIVDTAAGAMAVHAAPSKAGDLLVVSVIAEPDVPAPVVLDQAHRIAAALGRGEPMPGRRSLFDLPLGTGHAWTLTEHVGRGPRDQESYRSTLPAWSAESEHNLLELDGSGFDVAAEALLRLVERGGADAKQKAVAKYHKLGFEAAAVTGIGMRSSAVAHEREVRTRIAALEFTRPYAVVAVAAEPGAGSSPWRGLPLFSAWITHADEAD